jgi:adenylate cyclase
LFALALELNEAMPLWPLSASKAERGYALYLQTRGAAAAAAPRPTQPISSEVDRRMAPRTAPKSDPNRPARDAFVPLAQAALDTLVPPLRTAALTPERGDAAAVEAVHQSRVALRRLRALLAAFAPALPGDWGGRERSHWRALAQALGRVRDLDVLRSEIGPQLMQAVPGSSASRWSAALAREQARAWRRLQAELQQPATTAQVLQFARALHGLSAASDGSAAHGRGPTLRALARQRLRHRQRRLRRALAAVLDTRARDAERVHALRIEVKKLRYATEALIDALPPKAAREAQRRLEVLISAQSALGRWHDWQLAAAWQGEVARRPTGADSALCAALQAELTRQRRRVQRACAALEAVI